MKITTAVLLVLEVYNEGHKYLLKTNNYINEVIITLYRIVSMFSNIVQHIPALSSIVSNIVSTPMCSLGNHPPGWG